jgi:catechol 2,3-dioxygenase-like lactoylglutathione lyase family enzyme
MRWLLLAAVSACPAFAQLAAPNDSGISLGHIHLMVADPEEHKKLWVGVFGGEVTKTGTLELVRLPGIYIILGKARTPPLEGSEGSTVPHIGIAVKDFEGTKAKLAALNIPMRPVPNNPKQTQTTFPDGVGVELIADDTLTTKAAMHHIHLATTEPEKERDWYAKEFGGRTGERGTFLAVFLPGGQVNTRKADKPQAPTKGRSLDHIGFEVKNLEAFCKKLEAEGVKFDSPYRDVPGIGLKIAFILDPDGTRIELTEGLAGK